MTFTEDEKQEIRIKAIKLFNDLPLNIRCVNIPSSIIIQIQELEMHKKEVKLMLKHINNRIDTLYISTAKELEELANNTN